MTQATVASDPRVMDLGRLAYAPALEVQRRVNQQVIDAGPDARPRLLLVEHDPVVTISHRRGAADHLLVSSADLRRRGIDVRPTDRGGDITYHGPGQLVAYPILCLRPLGLNLGRYMRLLEEVVIAALAVWGVRGVREQGATGVWTARPEARPVASPHGVEDSGGGEGGGADAADLAKICAMGVRVRKNVTMHGLALNVTTDLSHFQTIVPCGLAGRGVTSLQQVLGQACPTMDQVKAELIRAFRAALIPPRG